MNERDSDMNSRNIHSLTASFDDAGVKATLYLNEIDPDAGDPWSLKLEGPTGAHTVYASSYARILAHGSGFWANNNRSEQDFATWLLNAANELDMTLESHLSACDCQDPEDAYLAEMEAEFSRAYAN